MCLAFHATNIWCFVSSRDPTFASTRHHTDCLGNDPKSYVIALAEAPASEGREGVAPEQQSLRYRPTGSQVSTCHTHAIALRLKKIASHRG